MNQNFSICIVCYANYCRSPVAEAIFKNIFDNNLVISSAGIRPLYSMGMDPRSESFLKKNGFNYQPHFPKKISKYNLENNDLVLAMDYMVLNDLNNSFSRYKNKIKLFNHGNSEMVIHDPFGFKSEEKYEEMMNRILLISKEGKFL